MFVCDTVRCLYNQCNEWQEGVWTVCAHFAFCINAINESETKATICRSNWTRFVFRYIYMCFCSGVGAIVMPSKCRTDDGERNRMKCVQIMNALSISNASDCIDCPIPYNISNISHLPIPKSSIQRSTFVVTLKC